jgi:hypothetical protein
MSFILTDQESETAKRRLAKLSGQLSKKSQKLKQSGVDRKERKRLMHADKRQLKTTKQELAVYETLKSGNLPKNLEFIGLGRQLVYLRIASSLSQVDLAAQLGEEARKVDYDERNDYKNATVAYAQRVLSALKARVRLAAKTPKQKQTTRSARSQL